MELSTISRSDKGGAAESAAPHLSHSRLSKYLTCPEQYRLYYVEGLRPKVPAGTLVFGQSIHAALSHFFTTKEDPVAFFKGIWEQAKAIELRYSQRDTWESLAKKGEAMLNRFVQDEVPRIQNVRTSEQPFELSISNLDLPFVGVIDLIADVDGKRTVIDFKTASQSYDDYEVVLSDQLSAYQLAEPEAEQLALCVFVKTKEPQIEWHFATRNGRQLQEFLAKAEIVVGAIARGEFYKRPGKHCAWCDFLQTCMASSESVRNYSVG